MLHSITSIAQLVRAIDKNANATLYDDDDDVDRRVNKTATSASRFVAI